MKLAYFSQGYSPHDFRFILAFVEQGASVTFVQVEGRVRESRPLPAGCETIPLASADGHWSSRDALAGKDRLQQRLEQIRPDLLLAGPLHTAGWLASRVPVAPLVAMSHGFDLLYALPASEGNARCIQETLDAAQGFFADCPALVEHGLRLRHFDFADTVCVPWGIDLPIPPGLREEGANLRRSLGWEQATVLVSLRNWEPLYAVKELVAEFARAVQAQPELRLILGGGGSQQAEVEKVIRDLGMEQCIDRPGYVAEERIWALLAAADIYVSSARSDGSSITLLQAMAVGLPALVQDTGGNRDWVTPEAQGWLFDIDRPGSFGQTLEKCLAARDRWPALGNSAREKVAAQGDWRKNQHRLMEFLHQKSKPNGAARPTTCA